MVRSNRICWILTFAVAHSVPRCDYSTKIYEDDKTFAFLDIGPVNKVRKTQNKKSLRVAKTKLNFSAFALSFIGSYSRCSEGKLRQYSWYAWWRGRCRRCHRQESCTLNFSLPCWNFLMQYMHNGSKLDILYNFRFCSDLNRIVMEKELIFCFSGCRCCCCHQGWRSEHFVQ